MDNLLEFYDKNAGIVEAQVECFTWSENVRLLEDDALIDELESFIPYSDQLEIDILPIIYKYHDKKENVMLTPEDRRLLESTYILVSSNYLIDVESGDLVSITIRSELM